MRLDLSPQTKKLNDCAQAVATNVLGSNGYPTSQKPNIRLHNGLDSTANIITRNSYSGADAVTQGTDVYVRPGANSRTIFKEVAHTAQFQEMGTLGFYAIYGILAVIGLVIADIRLSLSADDKDDQRIDLG